MNSSRSFFIPIAAIVLLMGLSLSRAQDACTALLQDVLRNFIEACANTPHGSVCYGYPDVTLRAFDDTQLNRPGDLAAVAAVDTLDLSPMNLHERTFGMAVLRPQAGLPAQTSATLLAFGDVTLRNARRERLERAAFTGDYPPFEQNTLTGAAALELNLRSGPGVDFPRVTFLQPGREVLVFGRSSDARWLRVQRDEAVVGWVAAEFLAVSGGTIDDLPIVSDAALPPVRLQPVRIGETTQARITDQVYEYRYAFAGLAGDVLDMTMRAADDSALDAYLVLQDERGTLLASANDSLSLDNFTDAHISAFTLPETGTYFLTATRFLQGEGFSTGGFALTVDYTPSLNFLAPLQSLDMASRTPTQLACLRDSAPPSGVLLQSPDVAAPVGFRINGLQLQVAGTAFLQAEPGGVFRVFAIDGNARAESLGTAAFIPQGSVLSVPLGTDLRVAGSLDTPRPYPIHRVAQLPTNVLTRKITVADPIAPDAIYSGDVVITLSWSGGADLDLRLVEPDERRVFFGQPSLRSGATITEDAVPDCDPDAESQERLVWPHGQPHLGKQAVQVVVFDDCGGDAPLDWQLRIAAGDETRQTIEGMGAETIVFER